MVFLRAAIKYCTFMLVLPAIQPDRILNSVSNAFAVNIKVNLRSLEVSIVDLDPIPKPTILRKLLHSLLDPLLDDRGQITFPLLQLRFSLRICHFYPGPCFMAVSDME